MTQGKLCYKGENSPNQRTGTGTASNVTLNPLFHCNHGHLKGKVRLAADSLPSNTVQVGSNPPDVPAPEQGRTIWSRWKGSHSHPTPLSVRLGVTESTGTWLVCPRLGSGETRVRGQALLRPTPGCFPHTSLPDGVPFMCTVTHPPTPRVFSGKATVFPIQTLPLSSIKGCSLCPFPLPLVALVSV